MKGLPFWVYLALAAVVLLLCLAIWHGIRRSLLRRRKQKYLQEGGRKGEQALEEAFEALGGYRRILSNVYIPTARSTTEIDLIMLHHSGVYVVENKSYSGWIFGSSQDQYWLQTFPNGERMNFYNPIRQNQGHIASLMKFLGREDREHFHSIIVFSDRCTFKELDLRDTDAWIIHASELRRTLKKAGKSSRYCLTRSEISKLYRQLEPRTRVSSRVKRDHLRMVRNKK